MKKLLYLLPIFFAGLVMNSCTFHKGQIVDLNYGQAVSISNQAVGISSAGYFFGLGGNKSSVLLKEAKDDLIRNRPLKANEKYVNQNLNVSTSYFLIYSRTKFTITADVISTDNNSSTDQLKSIEKNNNELFNYGDSLISKSQAFKGVFIEKMGTSEVKVINRKQVHQLLNSDKVYRKNGQYKGYQIDEKISFKGEFKGSGLIKGFGTKSVLVVNKDGSKYTVKYDEITQP